MVDDLKDKYNYKMIIATALPDLAAIAIARYFGITKQLSTSYQTVGTGKNEEFTGELGITLATSGSRCAVAIEQVRNIPRDHPAASVLAFDDSMAGIGMLFVVDKFGGAFCVNPSPQLRNVMRQCGWKEIPQDELNRETMPKELKEYLDNRLPTGTLLKQ